MSFLSFSALRRTRLMAALTVAESKLPTRDSRKLRPCDAQGSCHNPALAKVATASMVFDF